MDTSTPKIITRDNEDRLQEALHILREASLSKQLEEMLLASILEITKAINNNFSTDQLLKIYEFILHDELKIEKLALFSYLDGWECMLYYGIGDDHKKIDVENDLGYITEITQTSTSLKNHLNHFNHIIPVFHKSRPLAYLLIKYQDEGINGMKNKIISFVHVLTNVIVVAIENKKLAKQRLHQERVRKELELAGEMQSMLFPSALPKNDKLEIAALYKPHQQVGGDYYDFIQLNEHEVAICMADVSGKGVSAALLMSNFQANLRALFSRTKTLTELIQELNRKVMASAKGEKFITLFVAKYNLTTKIFTYINAGHNPPVLCNKNSCNLLTVGCTGLGMFEELPNVKEGIFTISEESVLVCYTDGVVEQENAAKEEFGMDNLVRLVSSINGQSMEDLNKNIADSVALHKGELPYVDDIALVSCRIF